jgi:hypothetical protein
MATNREVITASLRMLGVLDADETASAEDATLALDEMNSLMATLAADGIELGFPPQDSLSDDFPLDEQAQAQVKSLLAVMLLPFFPAANISPVLAGRADQARTQLARAAVQSDMEESIAAVPMGSARGGYYDIDSGQ